jgi:hypothetical protein
MTSRDRDDDLDLLTAALLGLTVGVGVTLLLRRGPSGRRPLVMGAELAGRGARLAGLAGMTGAATAGRAAMRGARRSREWAEELPFDEIGDQIREYFEAAKGAIEDTVSGELQDLRKSIRRRRRRLGI